jgi:Uma2 family endonuclease
MAHATKALMTAEEFALLPDDDVRRELVEGEVIEMGPGGYDHSAIAFRIAHLIELAATPEDAGRVTCEGPGFALSGEPATVRAPDVAFVRKGRLPGGRRPAGFFPGGPDLAVEVVSPGDAAGEIEAKVAEYLAAGALLVWVVYPEQRRVWAHRSPSEAFAAGEDGTLTADPVLPGLSIRVADML